MFLSGAEELAVRHAQNVAVQRLLDRLRPSLAVLGDARRPTGMAALLDAEQGLFIAHRDAVRDGSTVWARMGPGTVKMHVRSVDARTDLVLLELAAKDLRLSAPGLAVADGDPTPGSKVVVLLAEGGLVGSFVGGQKTLLAAGRPAVPASELRFETPPQLVGGALLLSLDGKLIGTMGATVARAGNVAAVGIGTLEAVQKIVQSQNKAAANLLPKVQFGPAPLTVAFTPNLDVMRRTVAGFLSESHRAEYSALGVLVADAPGGGAVVVRITPDSPAARGGLRVGDVLLAMGDRAIARQYDFIRALVAFSPGEKTVLHVRRDGVERQVEVLLARSKL